METIYNFRIFIMIAIVLMMGYLTSRPPKDKTRRARHQPLLPTQIPTELPHSGETQRPAKTPLRDSVIVLIASGLIYVLFHMEPP